MKAQWEPTHWTHNTHNVKALREKLCLGKMWSFTELESCLLLSDRRACKDVHLFLMSGCPWKSCQTRTCRSSAMSNILQIVAQFLYRALKNGFTTPPPRICFPVWQARECFTVYVTLIWTSLVVIRLLGQYTQFEADTLSCGGERGWASVLKLASRL